MGKGLKYVLCIFVAIFSTTAEVLRTNQNIYGILAGNNNNLYHFKRNDEVNTILQLLRSNDLLRVLTANENCNERDEYSTRNYNDGIKAKTTKKRKKLKNLVNILNDYIEESRTSSDYVSSSESYDDYNKLENIFPKVAEVYFYDLNDGEWTKQSVKRLGYNYKGGRTGPILRTDGSHFTSQTRLFEDGDLKTNPYVNKQRQPHGDLKTNPYVNKQRQPLKLLKPAIHLSDFNIVKYLKPAVHLSDFNITNGDSKPKFPKYKPADKKSDHLDDNNRPCKCPASIKAKTLPRPCRHYPHHIDWKPHATGDYIPVDACPWPLVRLQNVCVQLPPHRRTHFNT